MKHDTPTPMAGETMTVAEAAKYLGCAPKTLANHRYLNDGWPRYIKIGPPPAEGKQDRRKVVYEAADVRRFRDSGFMTHTEAR